MKHVIAIVLLCLPAQLSAGGRCPYAQASRDEVAPARSPPPIVNRGEIARIQNIRALVAWKRSLLFEQQIL